MEITSIYTVTISSTSSYTLISLELTHMSHVHVHTCTSSSAGPVA